MIIVKLMGGLGNQMFQYAAGRSLAIHKNETLVLDTTFYKEQDDATAPRQFELDAFDINAQIASTPNLCGGEDKSLLKLKLNTYLDRYFENPIIRIKRKLKLNTYFEGHFGIPIINRIKKKLKLNTYLDGHFQSEKYFKNIENIILKDFLPIKDVYSKHKEILNLIYESESVSIHIRRGDYAENPKTNQFHGLCSLDYYKEAIKYIYKTMNKPVFFVFSDDIEWVKKNLHISEHAEYISDTTRIKDYEEMYIMSKCKHNIIANSSFSWWGAWLNQNSKKIIIAPEKWFNDENFTSHDLIPASWIKL